MSDRSGAPLIHAKGVWKIFGRHADKVMGTPDADLPRSELREKHGCVAAVRDVSFDVWPGEIFVVMGLSGSGKSTLVRTLIRLIEPTAGEIEIDGKDVCAASQEGLRQLRRHTSAMVFQHFGLLAHRRVIDNVAFGLEVQGVPKAQRLARAAEVLALVGLEDAANQFPDRVAQTQVRIASTPAVARRVVAAAHTSKSPGELLAESSVSTEPNTDLLQFTVEDPESWFERGVRVIEQSCPTGHVMLRSESAVSGMVQNADGRSPAGVSVELVSSDS